MSGGHFDYKDSYLGYIAEQLEQNVGFNDIEDNIAMSSDEHYGFQHQPETIEFVKIMIEELYKLKDLLREYDYYVSGDSAEENFLAQARLVYPARREEKC